MEMVSNLTQLCHLAAQFEHVSRLSPQALQFLVVLFELRLRRRSRPLLKPLQFSPQQFVFRTQLPDLLPAHNRCGGRGGE